MAVSYKAIIIDLLKKWDAYRAQEVPTHGDVLYLEFEEAMAAARRVTKKRK